MAAKKGISEVRIVLKGYDKTYFFLEMICANKSCTRPETCFEKVNRVNFDFVLTLNLL